MIISANPSKLLPRILALFLSVTFCLPTPASALRMVELKENPKGVKGLEEVLIAAGLDEFELFFDLISTAIGEIRFDEKKGDDRFAGEFHIWISVTPSSAGKDSFIVAVRIGRTPSLSSKPGTRPPIPFTERIGVVVLEAESGRHVAQLDLDKEGFGRFENLQHGTYRLDNIKMNEPANLR